LSKLYNNFRIRINKILVATEGQYSVYSNRIIRTFIIDRVFKNFYKEKNSNAL